MLVFTLMLLVLIVWLLASVLLSTCSYSLNTSAYYLATNNFLKILVLISVVTINYSTVAGNTFTIFTIDLYGDL